MFFSFTGDPGQQNYEVAMSNIKIS